mmetsp:Transcript_51579/g.46340  ORF Transcript_51579/g.46340 Transcript_51579/m.46340 type:complete len:163 (+) Transcript_51579:89-577(+)|eukprot:CAMPEP_0201585780 /NCGR_PEP_ID=MMETSP0190_2-20130828/125470_1 /ASSEMBLY_ACC=CAM_ASM_000263 /TAXON_ID=37353 /ORGANISM="Rosalina sp." /LENGTH=162 /DNA_ID=CAMNT_0048032371 /DNA_START=80 /DNA_END=568 /DNA_ORIENTATION=+
MGTAAYGNTTDAQFGSGEFRYNNNSGNDPQKIQKWEITKSSDKPDQNKNQIWISAHDTNNNTIKAHVVDANKISSQPGSTFHEKTMNHFKTNETSTSDNHRYLTGGAHQNGQFKGNSTTINSNNDGYHNPNRQASNAEMNMMKHVFDSSKSGKTQGTFKDDK